MSTWSVVALKAPRSRPLPGDSGQPWLVLEAPLAPRNLAELSAGCAELVFHQGQTTSDVYRFVHMQGARVCTDLAWGMETGWASRVASPEELSLLERIARERAEDPDDDEEVALNAMSHQAVAALCARLGLDGAAPPAGALARPGFFARLFSGRR